MNKTSLISSFARKMDLYQFMIPGTILLEQYLINPFYHVVGGNLWSISFFRSPLCYRISFTDFLFIELSFFQVVH